MVKTKASAHRMQTEHVPLSHNVNINTTHTTHHTPHTRTTPHTHITHKYTHPHHTHTNTPTRTHHTHTSHTQTHFTTHTHLPSRNFATCLLIMRGTVCLNHRHRPMNLPRALKLKSLSSWGQENRETTIMYMYSMSSTGHTCKHLSANTLHTWVWLYWSWL